MKPNAWTSEELALLVAVYFSMLEKEQAGVKYSKADHNRQLQKLIARSHGSIEMKWMNVSAVLSERGLPFVKGYKPYPNYQAALKDVVLAASPASVLDVLAKAAQSLAPTVAQVAHEVATEAVA